MGVQGRRSRIPSVRVNCWLLPRRRTWPSLGTPAAAMLLGVTSPNVSLAPLPGPGLGLATPLAFHVRAIGLAFPAHPVLVPKRPRVGVQLPRSSIQSGREDCWMLPRRRAWPSMGNPAAAMLPGVTSPSVSPAPLPVPSSRPGLGSSHAPSISWPGVRIGCTCSSMLSPKRPGRGSPATLKQPCVWA